jgi:hypothetical protein
VQLGKPSPSARTEFSRNSIGQSPTLSQFYRNCLTLGKCCYHWKLHNSLNSSDQSDYY